MRHTPILLVFLASLTAMFALVGCGSSGPGSDQSSVIADAIGADLCTRSDYQLENRLDNSTATIYDCNVKGAVKCVTYNNGIASDETEMVKLLFAKTLSSGRPDCMRR